MYQDIKTQIAQKCAALDRPPPKLIAVSKRQPDANVEAVLKKGQTVFGENQVQEAGGKWPIFRQTYPNIELHLLGPLQTNKVNAAFELFQCIHSLDRIKLAQKLAKAAQSKGHCPDLFIQINTGAEPQKSGLLPSALPDFLKETASLDLPIIGLMCIPPASEDPRPHFRQLRTLAEAHDLPNLSMGMSGDYLIAIEEGATHIRVGSAIFGIRNY